MFCRTVTGLATDRYRVPDCLLLVIISSAAENAMTRPRSPQHLAAA
jgi:hypothetical protein